MKVLTGCLASSQASHCQLQPGGEAHDVTSEGDCATTPILFLVVSRWRCSLALGWRVSVGTMKGCFMPLLVGCMTEVTEAQHSNMYHGNSSLRFATFHCIHGWHPRMSLRCACYAMQQPTGCKPAPWSVRITLLSSSNALAAEGCDSHLEAASVCSTYQPAPFPLCLLILFEYLQVCPLLIMLRLQHLHYAQWHE